MAKVKRKVLSKEILDLNVSYDPFSGLFTRVGWTCHPTGRRGKIGDIIGNKTPSGYVKITIDGVTYLGHRLAFLAMDGSMPDFVDHADMNRANNKWDNLRACNQSQNIANQGKPKKSKSGFKGVTWCNQRNHWRAKITVNGKVHHLGRHKDPKEGAKAYAEACKFYFGEFGRAE